MMDDQMLERLTVEAERLARRDPIVKGLMKKDPQLSFVSAFIIAGDIIEAEDAYRDLVAGEITYRTAMARAGSYGRLDLAVRALRSGYVSLERLAEQLPDLWSGSDPDDTDPRFLRLWRDAYRLVGRTLKQRPQDKPLPRHKYLSVYRGQDADAPFGIAWSLDVDVAAKFARGAATRQLNRYGVIYSSQVRREAVLGWMPNRGESEVVIDPDDLAIRPFIIDGPTPSGVPEV